MFLLGYIDLRFADESAFNLTPNVPYAWMPRGEQRGIPSRKGGTLNVFGLLNLQGALTSYQTTQTVTSQTLIEWLDEFAGTIEKTTVAVMDNAPWHVSKAVEAKLEQWQEQGLFIFHLPPYSPHLNPIETLWRKMKLQWLQPQDYENKETLHHAIKHILINYHHPPYNIEFSIKSKSKSKR